MSYGSVYIVSDLKTKSVKQVAVLIHDRYEFIPLKRAFKLANWYKKNGDKEGNPFWKASSSELNKEKRKKKAMQEFNLVENN